MILRIYNLEVTNVVLAENPQQYHSQFPKNPKEFPDQFSPEKRKNDEKKILKKNPELIVIFTDQFKL